MYEKTYNERVADLASALHHTIIRIRQAAREGAVEFLHEWIDEATRRSRELGDFVRNGGDRETSFAAPAPALSIEDCPGGARIRYAGRTIGAIYSDEVGYTVTFDNTERYGCEVRSNIVDAKQAAREMVEAVHGNQPTTPEPMTAQQVEDFQAIIDRLEETGWKSEADIGRRALAKRMAEPAFEGGDDSTPEGVVRAKAEIHALLMDTAGSLTVNDLFDRMQDIGAVEGPDASRALAEMEAAGMVARERQDAKTALDDLIWLTTEAPDAIAA